MSEQPASALFERREFIKRLGLGGIGFASMLYLPGCRSGTGAEKISWSPESQGISSQGLIDFFDAVSGSDLEFHSIMINRNGKTVLEGWWQPYAKEYVHALYSLSKAFTSTAIGMLHDEGKISVEDKVVSFFPEQLPATVSENLAAMRIYDLLTMHTGHDQDTMFRIRQSGEDDWVKAFFALEVPQPPGSLFIYNTGATYILSAIAQEVSGENLMTYLKPRLFDPLGITGADWEEDPRGINVGGYGLRIRTQDILNFGQLYLQKGNWNGNRLLSEQWIEEATRKQVNSQDNDSDWGQGYGYQFWRCKPGCYRGDGAYGQYCIVVPEKNAVIAITSETRDMAASMQLVWDHILPAMEETPMEENPAIREALQRKAASLRLPVNPNLRDSPLEQTLTNKTYTFAKNPLDAERVSFSFSGSRGQIVVVEKGHAITITSGKNEWLTAHNKKEGKSLFPIPGRTPMATKFSSHYSWQDEKTLVVVVKYVENAHADYLKFTFNDKDVELEFDNSVSRFSDREDDRPVLNGRLSETGAA